MALEHRLSQLERRIKNEDFDDDVDDTYIEIECYLSKVESLVVIFKVFDIYIDMVDYVDYNYE